MNQFPTHHAEAFPIKKDLHNFTNISVLVTPHLPPQRLATGMNASRKTASGRQAIEKQSDNCKARVAG